MSGVIILRDLLSQPVRQGDVTNSRGRHARISLNSGEASRVAAWRDGIEWKEAAITSRKTICW
jgi:hypothetical protein